MRPPRAPPRKWHNRPGARLAVIALLNRKSIARRDRRSLLGRRISLAGGPRAIRSWVHFHRLPVRIVEYAPQFRDFDFILVDDDILIVDPYSHKIAAVISA